MKITFRKWTLNGTVLMPRFSCTQITSQIAHLDALQIHITLGPRTHPLHCPQPAPSTSQTLMLQTMQCNVTWSHCPNFGKWATTLFELFQERNVHVPRRAYALHPKFLRVYHTFTHIHLTLKNVIWFNRLTTKFHHDLHNLFLMEITLNNAHRAALARGHSIDRHYIKITV